MADGPVAETGMDLATEASQLNATAAPPNTTAPTAAPDTSCGIDCFDNVVTDSNLTIQFILAGFMGLVMVTLFSCLYTRVRVYRTRLLLPQVAWKPPPLRRDLLYRCWYWIVPVLVVTDDQLLRTAGLDALMLMRTLLLGIQMFLPMALISSAILIPVHYHVDPVQDGGSEVFERMTMRNISDHSRIMWLHFVLVYLYIGYALWLIYSHWHRYIVNKRKYFSMVAGEVWDRSWLNPDDCCDPTPKLSDVVKDVEMGQTARSSGSPAQSTPRLEKAAREREEDGEKEVEDEEVAMGDSRKLLLAEGSEDSGPLVAPLNEPPPAPEVEMVTQPPLGLQGRSGTTNAPSKASQGSSSSAKGRAAMPSSSRRLMRGVTTVSPQAAAGASQRLPKRSSLRRLTSLPQAAAAGGGSGGLLEQPLLSAAEQAARQVAEATYGKKAPAFMPAPLRKLGAILQLPGSSPTKDLLVADPLPLQQPPVERAPGQQRSLMRSSTRTGQAEASGLRARVAGDQLRSRSLGPALAAAGAAAAAGAGAARALPQQAGAAAVPPLPLPPRPGRVAPTALWGVKEGGSGTASASEVTVDVPAPGDAAEAGNGAAAPPPGRLLLSAGSMPEPSTMARQTQRSLPAVGTPRQLPDSNSMPLPAPEGSQVLTGEGAAAIPSAADAGGASSQHGPADPLQRFYSHEPPTVARAANSTAAAAESSPAAFQLEEWAKQPAHCGPEAATAAVQTPQEEMMQPAHAAVADPSPTELQAAAELGSVQENDEAGFEGQGPSDSGDRAWKAAEDVIGNCGWQGQATMPNAQIWRWWAGQKEQSSRRQPSGGLNLWQDMAAACARKPSVRFRKTMCVDLEQEVAPGEWLRQEVMVNAQHYAVLVTDAQSKEWQERQRRRQKLKLMKRRGIARQMLSLAEPSMMKQLQKPDDDALLHKAGPPTSQQNSSRGAGGAESGSGALELGSAAALPQGMGSRLLAQNGSVAGSGSSSSSRSSNGGRSSWREQPSSRHTPEARRTGPVSFALRRSEAQSKASDPDAAGAAASVGSVAEAGGFGSPAAAAAGAGRHRRVRSEGAEWVGAAAAAARSGGGTLNSSLAHSLQSDSLTAELRKGRGSGRGSVRRTTIQDRLKDAVRSNRMSAIHRHTSSAGSDLSPAANAASAGAGSPAFSPTFGTRPRRPFGSWRNRSRGSMDFQDQPAMSSAASAPDAPAASSAPVAVPETTRMEVTQGSEAPLASPRLSGMSEGGVAAHASGGSAADDSSEVGRGILSLRRSAMESMAQLLLHEEESSNTAEFFRALFPDEFLRVIPVRDHTEVDKMLMDWDHANKVLAAAEADPLDPSISLWAVGNWQPFRSWFCSCFGPRVNKARLYRQVVRGLELDIERARLDALQAPPGPSSFVLFKTQRAAQMASQVVLHFEDQRVLKVRAAPGLEEVNWPVLNTTLRERELRVWIVALPLIALMALPVGVFTGALSELQKAICNEEGDKDVSIAADTDSWYCDDNGLPSMLVTRVAPVVLLALWQNMVMPNALYYLSQAERNSFSLSDLDMRIFRLFFYWNLFNVFFGGVLGGSVTSQLERLLNSPNEALTILGQTIPESSNYFVNYVVWRALAFVPLRLVLPHGGIWRWLFSLGGYCGFVATDHDAAVVFGSSSVRYGRELGVIILVFLIVIAYSVITPFIVPCGLLYFVVSWVVWRYQLLYVYVRAYEAAGKHWQFFFVRLLICLLVFQLFTGAVLIFKKAFLQASILFVTVPILLYRFYLFFVAKYADRASHLPMTEAMKAPAADIPRIMYTPPALRPQCRGWHPQTGLAWEGWGSVRHTL